MNQTIGKSLTIQPWFICYFVGNNKEHYVIHNEVKPQISYNIIYLAFQIRQNDRLAVSKLVTSLTRGSVRSPLAQCLLIRYTSQV